jgi:ArsR family transcriptional regulator
MKPQNPPNRKIADLLACIGNPARVNILLAIGTGEACVCHIESLLELRQAYISQQLMILRRKMIINSRRQGKYIFYRLVNPRILDLIQSAGEIMGVPKNAFVIQDHSNCECPKCIVETNIISSDLANGGYGK